MKIWPLLAGILIASTVPSFAQEYRLKSFGGATNVIVWRSSDAQSEGMKLIEAGVHKTNPELVARLVACFEKPGTKVIVTDMGFLTHDIMVVEGENAGCKGNIPREELAH